MIDLLKFNPEITVSDIISILSFISIIIGGVFALIKWNKDKKLKRAEYMQSLIDKIENDNSSGFYIIEYNYDWYDASFHDNKELENKIDYTLSYFNYICYLKMRRIITKNEFLFFEYQIKRIFHNPGVQNYFYNLYHFSLHVDSPMSFPNLFKYGKKHKLFDKLFGDKEAYKKNSKYSHILNF